VVALHTEKIERIFILMILVIVLRMIVYVMSFARAGKLTQIASFCLIYLRRLVISVIMTRPCARMGLAYARLGDFMHATKDTLRKEIEMIIPKVKETIKRDGFHPHLLIIFNKKHEYCVVQNNFGKDDKKINFLILRKYLRDNARYYLSINEAFYLSVPKDSVSNVLPSESPDRKECIVIYGASPDHAVNAMLPFHREGSNIVFDEYKIADISDNDRRFNTLDAWYYRN
jgi:hypothetical protein